MPTSAGRRACLAAVAVMATALPGCTRMPTDGGASSGAREIPAPAALAPLIPAGRGIELPRFVNLVKEQGPAVVNISATREAVPGGVPPGHPLYDFFRHFGGPPDSGEAGSASVGSGFIISDDGYILTNAHVVAGTDTVRVKLTTKREYPAKVIGADPYTDVALLKISATGLRAVSAGNPAEMEPGEWVAAIGAPFGFENSVTVGVVSAKGRLLPNGSYVPFIQTDVAVNPGNSGGPLFNTAGRVIGINSQIYSQTGGFMGIAFAIPIDIAMDISAQLREHGKVIRGRIGVQLQELTYELATALELKEPRGALVAAVQPDGPAHRAGIRPADVVVAAGGKPVETTADLARIIGSARPGQILVADVWRKGDRLAMKIRVELQR